ncbi:MAG: NADP-dependent malic enzyme [Candidatus Auribacterota bacterium]|nr:NADP-dependent malic enzyme [Candidatus Auribacterota bacterium]
MPEINKEELLKKAEQPARDAMRLHPFYRGKIEIVPKCRVRSTDDFAIWYTPGVAAPCTAINKNPELVYSYTNKWNSVAVITDGSRVLGLGDIGPEAALPTMEGKALLFKYLGGVDAYPICLDTKDPEEIIRTVKILQPSFGGINLEDISQPKCFDILDRLRKECRIPVWHDDQQGTAAVTLAGLINALEIVEKDISEVRITMVGAGAANLCIARMVIAFGADPDKIIICDSKDTLHKDRTELESTHPQKWEMCLKTNPAEVKGGAGEAIRDADVLIALSHPGPDTISREWITRMASDAVCFLCANPTPELWPWDAKEAGARIVATGRSDFPNQINNSLGFPGIFRGALDVRASAITDEMCIAASRELAACARDKGINEEYLIPTMDEWEVYPRVAVAVGMKAVEQGIAATPFSREELSRNVEEIIKRSREEALTLMKEGYIP